MRIEFYCHKHGVVYLAKNIKLGDVIDSSKVIPINKDYPMPKNGEKIQCPVCESELKLI